LIKRFYDNISKKDAFAAKYGKADIDDDTLYKFICTMIEHCKKNMCVRDACEILDREMTALSSKSLLHFNEQLKHQTGPQLPLCPPAKIEFDSIPYTDGLSKDELILNNPNLSVALSDRFCKRAIESRLKDKHPIEYFALNHPSVAQPSVNVLAPVVNYNNITINVGNDPNLMKEYKKVVHEKEMIMEQKDQLIRKLKDIVKSDDMDIETTKRLINDMISSSIECKQISNGKDEVKSKKRKILMIDANNKPQAKRLKTNEKSVVNSHENGDDAEGRTCWNCKEWKPITQYQRTRQGKQGEYLYTYPVTSKCLSCLKTKDVKYAK
jgi:hypothetical protein